LNWNEWPASNGTGGRLPPDYMADFTGIRIRDGFGTAEAGEDAFDAVLGLMSMIEVLLDHRSDGVPSIGNIRDIEGWIFGQAYEPANQ